MVFHMDDDDALNKLLKSLTPEELDRLIHGMTPEERQERDRQYTEAQKLIGLPPNDWPEFKVVWDVDPAAQRLAFDGMTEAEFSEYYPDHLPLKYVRLAELDAQLCNYNKRTAEEVWGVGDNGKAAKVLLAWIEGRKITPPALSRTNSTSEVMLAGGNHRLAVARAKGEATIPVLLIPEHLDFLSQKLSFLDSA